MQPRNRGLRGVVHRVLDGLLVRHGVGHRAVDVSCAATFLVIMSGGETCVVRLVWSETDVALIAPSASKIKSGEMAAHRRGWRDRRGRPRP